MMIRAVLLLAGLLLALPAQAQQVPNPMARDAGNAALPEARLNLGVATFDPVRDHNAPTDGTSDAAAQINASLQDCGNAAGGRVILPPRQYAVIGADLTVPAGCSLEMASPPRMQSRTGPGPGPGGKGVDIDQPAIRLDSARTIQNYGMVRSLAIFKRGLTYPTSLQDTWNQVNGFAGTAITNGTDDTQIDDVFIVGFGLCIRTDGHWHSRPYIRHARLHCKNGLYFNDIHDVAHVTDVHGWGYFPGNDPNGYAGRFQSVTGVADNGAGLIRVTTDSTADLVTGNPVGIREVTGMTGVNGNWTITVVDATHLDLQGSSFAGVSRPGTLALDETFVAIAAADMKGIWMGQAVTGAGIAPGTTVRSIDPHKPGIWLSLPATASASGTTLTFANGAFSGNGWMYMDPNMVQMETFISVTYSEEMHFSDIFQYGWKVGAYLGTDAIWSMFSNFSCDHNLTMTPDRVCMYWDSNARVSGWVGGQGGGNSIMLVDKSVAGVNSVVGVNFREATTPVGPYINMSLQGASESLFSGLYSSCGNSCNPGGYPPSIIAIYAGAGRKSISGMLPMGDVYPQNFNTALNSMLIMPGTILALGSPFSNERFGWSPTLHIGGFPSAGTTYVAQQAIGEKRWPWVESDLTMVLSAKGGGAGGVAIGGFPYSCGILPSGSGLAMAVVDPAVGLTGVPMFEQVNASPLINVRQTSATGLGYVTDANILNNTVIRGQFKCVMNWVQR